jgi:hypothetical protein
MLPVMALQLEPASPVSAAAVGELIDPSGLAARAAEVAARQRSPETRRTYAAVYRMCPTAGPGVAAGGTAGAAHHAAEQRLLPPERSGKVPGRDRRSCFDGQAGISVHATRRSLGTISESFGRLAGVNAMRRHDLGRA